MPPDAGYDRIDALMRQCAHLYNAALEERIDCYQKTGQSISLYEQYGSLTEIRKADPLGYGAFSVTVSRGVLIRLDNAMKRFFNRVKQGETPGFPRFRPSNRWKTMELKETHIIDGQGPRQNERTSRSKGCRPSRCDKPICR